MRRLLAVLIVAAAVSGCATAAKPVPPEALPIWLLYSLEQRGSNYVWIPNSKPETQAECRIAVRERSKLGPIQPIAMLGWYMMTGAPTFWWGCFPVGYDPYAPR